MGAGRGGGAKSRHSSHYFPEKNTCGGILFVPAEGPFFMWGVIFSYGGVLGGFAPLSPHPSYKELCWHPCPTPWAHEEVFRGGWAFPKSLS